MLDILEDFLVLHIFLRARSKGRTQSALGALTIDWFALRAVWEGC